MGDRVTQKFLQLQLNFLPFACFFTPLPSFPFRFIMPSHIKAKNHWTTIILFISFGLKRSHRDTISFKLRRRLFSCLRCLWNRDRLKRSRLFGKNSFLWVWAIFFSGRPSESRARLGGCQSKEWFFSRLMKPMPKKYYFVVQIIEAKLKYSESNYNFFICCTTQFSTFQNFPNSSYSHCNQLESKLLFIDKTHFPMPCLFVVKTLSSLNLSVTNIFV